MMDCRLYSLVFCHAHSAQILEFLDWSAIDASIERLQAEMEEPDRTFGVKAEWVCLGDPRAESPLPSGCADLNAEASRYSHSSFAIVLRPLFIGNSRGQNFCLVSLAAMKRFPKNSHKPVRD